MLVDLCLFCRNEQKYLREWILHYQLLGINEIWIYDNGSIPALYIPENIQNVHLVLWPGEKENTQISSYNDCVATKTKANWLGCFDTDEFLVLEKHKTIQEFLQNYLAFAGVVLHWKMFGSSGHIKPQESILSSFIHAGHSQFEATFHVKSFGQVCLKPKWIDPHLVVSTLAPVVDTQKHVCIHAVHLPVQWEIAYLNHYFLRSKQEFQEKIDRGRGDKGPKRSIKDFYTYDQQCYIPDTRILVRHYHHVDKEEWEYYLDRYPDLRKAGLNTPFLAQQHYQQHGIKERRKWGR